LVSYLINASHYLEDNFGQCKWSTNIGESHIFVKFDYDLLSIVDVEKKALLLKRPAELTGDDEEPDENGKYSLLILVEIKLYGWLLVILYFVKFSFCSYMDA